MKIENHRKIDITKGSHEATPDLLVSRCDWTMTLCNRCKSDFETSGYVLFKHCWQESPQVCEFCQVGRGWTYEIRKK